MTDKEIDDLVNSTKKLGREGNVQIGGINKQFNNLVNDGIKKAGAALVAVFAIDRAKQLLDEVVKITAEFQKFEAILTNTLGSKSQARIALREIAEFAAKTPFGVAQLTENFIKLANRGVKPTMDQMRGLGDLSATLGKDVEMLVEALLDVNNPERWKELGIVSQTAGDKVKLSFRGMTIEADRTVQGVTDAAVALGEMEGVAGSMAAVSVTLGGAISNADDSLDALFNTLGDGNKGVLMETVNLFTRAVEAANELVKTDEQRLDDRVLNTQKNAIEYFKLYLKGYGDVEKARAAFLADNQKRIEELDAEFHRVAELGEEKVSLLDRMMGRSHSIDKENERRRQSKQEINDQIVAYGEVEEAIDDYIKATEKGTTTTETKTKAVKGVGDELRDYLASLSELAMFETKNQIGANVSFRGREAENEERSLKLQEYFRELRRKKTEEEANEAIAIANDNAARRMMAEQIYYEGARDLALDYFEYRRALIQEELAMLDAAREHELKAAGKNEEAKDAITKKFALQEREIRKKQAQDQYAQAIFTMLVSQGPAVAKTIASLGFPAALPFVGLVLAQFALQMKQVQAAKAPKFATGVYDLQGPGTSTSDSIPAWLSRGEDVVPADRNKKFGFLLKEIIEDPSLELWDVKNIIDQKIPTQYATVFLNAKGADSAELRDIMRETQQAIRNLKQVNINIDENGFQNWTKKGHSWSRTVSKRYSS